MGSGGNNLFRHSISGLDYRSIEGLQKKRLLAFVNHYVTHTVDRLNTFCLSCDSRLMDISSRIKRLENSLTLLETKLEVIPGLVPAQNCAEDADGQGESAEDNAGPQPDQVESSAPISIKSDPMYRHFFKMLSVGVPEQAVRLKMQMQGLDDSILDSAS